MEDHRCLLSIPSATRIAIRSAVYSNPKPTTLELIKGLQYLAERDLMPSAFHAISVLLRTLFDIVINVGDSRDRVRY